MRKYSIIFAVLLLSKLAFSQEKGTSEIGISVGQFSSNNLLNTTEKIIQDIEGGLFENTKSKPTIAINYKFAIKNNWFIYADGTYQNIKKDITINSIKVGNVNHNFLTFGLGTEYHYIVKEWFQVYSGASIAYTSQCSDFTTSSSIFKDSKGGFFNFQVNAVGLRVGKTLAATLELGFGYKGIASLGVSYQF